MIEVSERAREELRNILNAHVDNPQACLRLAADSEGQFGLAIDIEQPGDQVVEHQGSGILVIEEELATTLDGVTIDIKDTGEGPTLVLS